MGKVGWRWVGGGYGQKKGQLKLSLFPGVVSHLETWGQLTGKEGLLENRENKLRLKLCHAQVQLKLS